MTKASLIIMALLGAASSAAMAQYTGPSSAKIVLPGVKATAPAAAATTVGALIKTGKDNALVSLQGRIVRHLGGDDYRFADSTGEINVEIDTEYWPANTPIDDKAEVRITGEFDKDILTKPKVEVNRLEKIK
jgi:uncharacterized protein (TIGR00156 family)